MNTQRLFILLVVISTIFVVIKFTKNPNRSKNYNEKLVDFDSQLVDKIEIKTADEQEQVVLEKIANQWKVQVGQKQHEAVQTSVEGFLRTIQTIKPSRLISRSADQWKDYDVDEKGTKVVISRSNDVLLDIILGRFAFEGQRTYYNYVRLGGDNDTYVADNFMKMSLLSQRDDFRNSRVLNIKNDSLIAIDFIYPDSSFSLNKKENSWFRDNIQVDSMKFKNYFDDIQFVNSKSFATMDVSRVPSHKVNFHFSNRPDINIMGILDEGEWLIKSSENKDEVWKDSTLSKKILVSNSYF